MEKANQYLIPTKLGLIKCMSYGKGIPLIFLHGGPGVSHDYLVPHFLKLSQDYQLIFYDQNGSGGSTLNRHKKKLTINNFVDVLHQIKNYFKFDHFHVISHSFGSLIALNYIVKYPMDITSHIMISPAPGNDDLDKQGRKELSKRLSEEDLINIKSILMTSPFEHQNIDAINELIHIQEKTRFYNKDFMIKFMHPFTIDDIRHLQNVSKKFEETLDNYDIYSTCHLINVKTMIIHGIDDPIPLISSKKYAELIPLSTLHMLRYCGHFPFIEKNQEVYDLIKQWLNSMH